MRYLAFAADYDGTLAHNGIVTDSTIAALKRLRDSGRHLLLVTGRIFSELKATFPRLDLFERIVLENGALIYNPSTKEFRALAAPPPISFLDRLRDKKVRPISTGQVIVATWEPHEKTVLQAIHELGLELQVIFNKGAVMILPSGINKATGLKQALKELGMSPHNCVGIGDAENDHAFLKLCECSTAVANALPAVKEFADIIAHADHGSGVEEIINDLLHDDLSSISAQLVRHNIALGHTDSGEEIALEAHGINVMIAGSSGSGKSTLTTSFLEGLNEAGYQYLIVDPEGDYSTLDQVVMLGDPKRPPLIEELMDLLAIPGPSVVVNLLGVSLEQRPAFFDNLLPRLQSQRSKTGRPHWIIVDETHHLMHVEFAPADLSLPKQLHNMLFITVHPESVAKSIVQSVDVLIVVGETPVKTLEGFCTVLEEAIPVIDSAPLSTGKAWYWKKKTSNPLCIVTNSPRSELQRHSRKYAEGNVGPDNSFYFRGPERQLNLKAQNLTIFLQIADGIDDATWVHHLKAGDYSAWVRDKIKDESLAEIIKQIERKILTPKESRSELRAAVESRYTLTADNPSGKVDS